MHTESPKSSTQVDHPPERGWLPLGGLLVLGAGTGGMLTGGVVTGGVVTGGVVTGGVGTGGVVTGGMVTGGPGIGGAGGFDMPHVVMTTTQ